MSEEIGIDKGAGLKVCASYLRQGKNRQLLGSSRIILLEHILPNTEELIGELSAAGAEIFAVVAKPYSIDQNVLQRILSRNWDVLCHSYHELETEPILTDLLVRGIEKSRSDNRRLVVIDVGGYFARPLSEISADALDSIAGVVEDTTFGHNRYLALKDKIRVPMYSVARSQLKEVESYFVGRDAVNAVDLVMRDIGVSMTGKNALVLGYGMIGTNVAKAARAFDVRVSTYDILDHRNLSAFMMGYNVNKKAELLRGADFVFASTGWSSKEGLTDVRPALSSDEVLELVKDNAVLASVGSKDNEFEVSQLRELAERIEPLSEDIEKFYLPNRKIVHLVHKGTAVNFLMPSIPSEVLDLVFTEIVIAVLQMLKQPCNVAINQVNHVPDKFLSSIAKDWLRFVNPQN